MINPKWKIFQDYIAKQLQTIDQYARSSKGSGNQGELGDVNNKCGLLVECKLRNTESCKIDKDQWKKLVSEVPLHSDRIPVLALENKEGKRWVVLDLDDFLYLYIAWYQMKFNGEYKEIV